MTGIFNRWRPIAVIALLAVGALTLVSASGLWSDSQTITGNTVQAGTVSLDLRSMQNKPISSNLVIGDPIHGVGGLLPGESTDPGRVDVYNDGTREQKQYMHVDNINGALCSYVSLTLGRDLDGGTITFNENIGTYPLSSLNGSGNRVEVGRDFGGGIVPDNFTTQVSQKATLHASTPNSFNGTGATCTWDEVFTAEQVAP